MAKRPSRKPSRADARRQAETRNGLMKIAGGFAVVALVAVIWFQVSSSRRDLNPDTLCPAEPESITVLIVDVTDPMNMPQRQDFQNQLAALRNSIPRYGQLIVAKVDATGDKLISPVIVKCNPGTAADENESTGDPKAVQRKHDTEFVAPLDAAFSSISQASGADQSPILESVQSVALTELLTPTAADKPRKIVLVSDLLQNTSDISFYGDLPDAGSFTTSAPFRRVRTDLRNVDVELWMLERGDAATTQPRALVDLWDQIIAKQGGTVSRAYNVSG